MSKMTKSERSAAGRKAARTRKRNAGSKTRSRKRTLSANGLPAKRRRLPTRKRGLLGQMGITDARVRGSAQDAFYGGIGGILASVIDSAFAPGTPTGKRLLWLGGASVVVGAMLEAPRVGAGVAGAAGYILADRMGLPKQLSSHNMHEETWINPQTLSEMPMYLDEGGHPIAMSEDEMYLAQGDEYYLAQDTDLYPGEFDDYASYIPVG